MTTAIGTRFDGLLPEGAVVVEAIPEMWTGYLYGIEESSIACAVESRRREFTAGRNCAREALSKLGLDRMPVPMGSDRAPIFPFNVSGTITHTGMYCAAAAVMRGAVASIGIDAESRAPLQDELAPLIFSDEEQIAFARKKTTDYDLRKLAFSAKEAFYKAYNQLAHTWLDFRDAEVVCDTNCRTFHIVILSNADDRWIGRSFLGYYTVDDERVYCAVAIHARDIEN